MKAAVVHGVDDVRYEEIPEPACGEGMVRVAVCHCGICGSDIPRVLKGTCHSFPQVLGHEFSGIVSEVGDQVQSVRPGDAVVGVPLVPCFACEDCRQGNFSLCRHYSFIGSRQQGGMAEQVVVPARNVLKIDASVPLDLAALFEPSTVALHGLMQAGYAPEAEDPVLVLGAGTIALLTVQWCRILGARNVVVIGRSRERLPVAQKYGASAALSSLDVGYQDEAMRLSGGRGFRWVFDAAGTGETIRTSLELAANKSTVCLIGTPTKPLEFSARAWEVINRKELYLTGSWMSYSAPWPGSEWKMTAACMANGKLKLNEDLFHAHIPLRDVRAAFDLFKPGGPTVHGRVMLDVR